MRKLILAVCCLAVTILALSCSESGSGPTDQIFRNITSADAGNTLTFYDPDDWCFGGVIETAELLILAPEIKIFANGVGDSGSTTVQVFNYSYQDRVLYTYTEDTVVTFDQYEVPVPSLSWASFEMTYHAYTEDIYDETVWIHVEPCAPVSEDLPVPVKGYPYPIYAVDVVEPLTYAFRNCYPNPTSDETRFDFSMPDRAHVRLTVRGPDTYLSDRYVLIDSTYEMGWHSYMWNVDGLESGIYRAYIEIGDDFECHGDVMVNPLPVPIY